MKKIYFLAFACFGLFSCQKAVLKETTIQLDFDNVNFVVDAEDGAKYVDSKDMKLLTDYMADLADHLGTGRIDIVQSGGDYTLQVTDLIFVETVERETRMGNTVDLSTVKMRTKMVLIETDQDIPTYIEIEAEAEEENDCPEMPSHLEEIEMEELMCDNLFNTRRKVKKTMLRNQ